MFHLFLASEVYRPLATWQSTPWVPWWSKRPPWPCAFSMKLPACRRSGGVLRVLLGSSYWFLMKISLLWLEIQYYDPATKKKYLDRIKFHPMMHYQSLRSLHNQVYLLSRFFSRFPIFWVKPSWLSAITNINQWLHHLWSNPSVSSSIVMCPVFYGVYPYCW